MAGKAEYKNQWQKENCDRVNLTLPKGRKAELQAHATAHGESVNGFISRAIAQTMERDGVGGPTEAPVGKDDILSPAPPSKPRRRPHRPQERACHSSLTGL